MERFDEANFGEIPLPDKVMLEFVNKSGILKRLKDAGKGKGKTDGYIALIPMFQKEKICRFIPINKLVYLLVPSDSSKTNEGYFTHKDLEAWIYNKGPIPKKGGIMKEKMPPSDDQVALEGAKIINEKIRKGRMINALRDAEHYAYCFSKIDRNVEKFFENWAKDIRKNTL